MSCKHLSQYTNRTLLHYRLQFALLTTLNYLKKCVETKENIERITFQGKEKNTTKPIVL